MKCPKLPIEATLSSRWHLLFCSECRRQQKLLKSIAAGFDNLGKPVAPKESLRATLQMIESSPSAGDQSASVKLKPTFLWGRYAIGGALAVGAACALGLFLLTRPAPKVERIATKISSDGAPTLRNWGNLVTPDVAPDQKGPSVVGKQPGDLQGSITRPDPTLRRTSLVKAAPLDKSYRSKKSYKAQNTTSQATKPNVDDLDYLNGESGKLAAHWVSRPDDLQRLSEVLGRPLPPMKDDFIAPPPILFASSASAPETLEMAEEAAKAYEQEAKIVDSRLFKNVTLSHKSSSMEEICEDLKKQLGVEIAARGDVRDENATIYIKSRPAREVMRLLCKVFGYIWERDGKEGQFSYLLRYDTKTQVLDEKLRNEDVTVGLKDVDDQLKKKLESLGSINPNTKEYRSLFALKETLNLFNYEDWAQIRSGKTLWWDTHSHQRNRLPDAIKKLLLDSAGRVVFQEETENCRASYVSAPVTEGGSPVGQWPSEIPGFTASVYCTLESTEYAHLELKLYINYHYLDPIRKKDPAYHRKGFPKNFPRSDYYKFKYAPYAGAPENKKWNAALNAQEPFRKEVSLNIKVPKTMGKVIYADPEEAKRKSGPEITTADLWEALYIQTGMDIIADSFLRMEHVPSSAPKGSLFEILGSFADATKVRWGYDENVLIGRSIPAHWLKLYEVPKRHLIRWQKEAAQLGYLDLASFIEMASLSNHQWESESSVLAARRLFSIPWDRSFSPDDRFSSDERIMPKFLGSLPGKTFEQLQQGTLLLEEFPIETLYQTIRSIPSDEERFSAHITKEIERLMRANQGKKLTVGFQFVPGDVYFWSPAIPDKSKNQRIKIPPLTILGKTEEAAKQNAQRLFPGQKGKVDSYGSSAITLLIKDGEYLLKYIGRRWFHDESEHEDDKDE